jgi:hypothetical protein
MPDNSVEYETVGFWKWAEAKVAGSILATILNQQLATHSLLLTGQFVENANAQPHQNAFLTAYPDPDFLEFVVAAKYTKDFDTNETLAGDLWAPSPQLGSPGTVEVFAYNDITLRDGDPGDSKDNPRHVGYSVTQFLSSDAVLVHSQDLTGSLHVKPPQLDPGQTLDAAIIVDRGGADGAVTRIEDLSLAHEDFVTRFSPHRRATILFVDPRWFNDPADVATSGEFEIWIEDPCADTPGTTVEVATANELMNAVTTMTGGNTIRLAPGTYSLEGVAPSPEEVAVCLYVDGLTLVGAGQDQTIIELNHGYIRLLGQSAALRNMTIRGNDGLSDQLVRSRAQDFTLCNVTLSNPDSYSIYGLTIRTPDGGGTGIVTNCTIIGGGPWRSYAGIHTEGEGSLSVENTRIYNFGYAIYQQTITMRISADCALLSGYYARNVGELQCN